MEAIDESLVDFGREAMTTLCTYCTMSNSVSEMLKK